jgi:predicted small metal-binding protein
MERYPSVSYSLFRREALRVKDILKNVVGEDKKSDEYQQFKQIIFDIFRLLNSFMLDDDGRPKMRDIELDENGERAFVLSHPIKVAQLVFQLLPQECGNTIQQDELDKVKEVRKNLRETAVTTFFHDFVEDVFEGNFEVARPIIEDVLNKEELQIPPDAQKRILQRIHVLTKPLSRYTSSSKILTKDEEVELYLQEYKQYLDTLINSNDPISQYIKVIDIFQNAQSQKNSQDKKRKGKAQLQADFIKEVFPTLAEHFWQQHRKLFENMSDQNFVEALRKNISNHVEEVIHRRA